MVVAEKPAVAQHDMMEGTCAVSWLAWRGAMHVEISMAKHGSAGGPFVGHVRGLVAMHGPRPRPTYLGSSGPVKVLDRNRPNKNRPKWAWALGP